MRREFALNCSNMSCNSVGTLSNHNLKLNIQCPKEKGNVKISLKKSHKNKAGEKNRKTRSSANIIDTIMCHVATLNRESDSDASYTYIDVDNVDNVYGTGWCVIKTDSTFLQMIVLSAWSTLVLMISLIHWTFSNRSYKMVTLSTLDRPTSRTLMM